MYAPVLQKIQEYRKWILFAECSHENDFKSNQIPIPESGPFHTLSGWTVFNHTAANTMQIVPTFLSPCNCLLSKFSCNIM
jgi:hypothetical protein